MSTIECYDCHRQVADLRTHRQVCLGRKQFRSTVECYNCHQQVVDLKLHRTQCRRSKKVTAHTKDVYFLLDVSGSMRGVRLDQAKATLLEMSDEILDHDRLAVVTFDDGAFFKLHPRAMGQIRRQQELPVLMDRIFARGSTAIYDAIWLAVEQIYDKNRKTLILVLTDGQDNSSKHTHAEVLALLKEYPNIQLDIVHVDGQSCSEYQQLVQNRGSYLVIEETQIKVELISVVKRFYQ